MKLWTVVSDYAATGEGRTLQALITYAEDEKDAIERFGKQFDPFFAIGAEAKEGVIKNPVTQYLFSDKVLDSALDMEGKANINLFSQFHFNFS